MNDSELIKIESREEFDDIVRTTECTYCRQIPQFMCILWENRSQGISQGAQDQVHSARKELYLQKKKIPETIDKLRDKCASQKDTIKSLSKILDSIWQIMYEGKTDWEYPGQVFVHINQYVIELKAKGEKNNVQPEEG